MTARFDCASRLARWFPLGFIFLSSALLVLTQSSPASALPGFFASKGAESPLSHSAHAVLMRNGGKTAVTIMVDYEGDLKPFAWVVPVPKDVEVEAVKTMKRDSVEHVDVISAPRFHEFWEMDPCDSEDLEQEWERDLKVKNPMAQEGLKKRDSVMLLDFDPEFKESVYAFSIVDANTIKSWLEGKGYMLPKGVAGRLGAYADFNFLIAEVDTKKLELLGDDRAILTPLRYVTGQEPRLGSTLGLGNADGKQELLLFVLDPERRMEVSNYKNVFPPTNIHVDFKVKERMGEFYAAIFDKTQEKNPGAFVVEYAWNVEGCGQPCPSTKLAVSELLTLGVDVFEEGVPDAERAPDPPEFSEEEKKQFEALEKEEQKRLEEERSEVARRKALLSRHGKYTLTRLHYRYDEKTLPKDVQLAPAPHIKGGIDYPKGPEAALPTKVEPADESQMQTRYTNLHPNITVVKCDDPKPARWGKAPRTYRGLRKIWVAQDMTRKNRKLFKPSEVVLTAIPDLEIAAAGPAVPAPENEGPVEAPKAEESKCGCRVPGAKTNSSAALGWGIVAGLLLFGRRRQAPRNA
jgi:MYXO-CTERM domain-containing protein